MHTENLKLAVSEAISEIAPALSLLESLVSNSEIGGQICKALDSLPFPAWVKNADCQLLWVNKAYEVHYKTCCCDCLGKTASKRHTDLHPKIALSDLEAMKTGELVSFKDSSLSEVRHILKLAIRHRGDFLVFGVSLPNHALNDSHEHLSLTG